MNNVCTVLLLNLFSCVFLLTVTICFFFSFAISSRLLNLNFINCLRQCPHAAQTIDQLDFMKQLNFCLLTIWRLTFLLEWKTWPWIRKKKLNSKCKCSIPLRIMKRINLDKLLKHFLTCSFTSLRCKCDIESLRLTFV
jgi:hypothetical protein